MNNEESTYLDIEAVKYPSQPRDLDELLNQVATLEHCIHEFPEYFQDEIAADQEVLRIVEAGRESERSLLKQKKLPCS